MASLSGVMCLAGIYKIYTGIKILHG